jgi:hypothetical protein
VLRALEKDRANRHATTAEFIKALEMVREEIPPDQKYGLGERMITLSAQPTIIDATAARRQRTATATKQAGIPSATVPRSQAKAGTTAGQLPTVIEKSATLSDQATVIERAGGAEAAPTVVESLGGAATATVIEPKVAKWQEGAAATVLERKGALPKKRAGLFVGLAAGLALIAGGGIYIAMRPEPVTGPVATTTAPADTSTVGTPATETTVVEATLTPVGVTNGILMLGGSPYDQISKIENVATKQAIELSAEDSSLPFKKELPAGRYRITTRADVREVEVVAGKPTRVTPKKPKSKIDLDRIVDEVLKEQ